jgi:hypothetical protein
LNYFSYFQIETFILDRNKLGPQGTKKLLLLLWENNNVRYLHLSNCDLMKENLRDISSGLTKNMGLVYLNLSNNSLGENMDDLSTSFEINHKLK